MPPASFALKQYVHMRAGYKLLDPLPVDRVHDRSAAISPDNGYNQWGTAGEKD